MATTKVRKKRVDPVDAFSAIIDFVEYMRKHKVSIGDLAIRLGWSNQRTEDFLFPDDVKSHTYEDLHSVAKELNIKLDF